MSITADEVRQIVFDMLKDYASLTRVDDLKVELEQMDYLTSNKIDSRNVVEYTFTGTSAEDIEHGLNRIPQGYIILNQTQNARIYGDSSTWTKKRVTLASSVANNLVRLLFL